MASAEYYLGTQGAQALHAQQQRPHVTHRHYHYPPPPMLPQGSSQPYPDQPPAYSLYPPPPQQQLTLTQHGAYQAPASPDAQSPSPNPLYPPRPAQSQTALMPPVQRRRSHSQPPRHRVRFADQVSSGSDTSTLFSPSEDEQQSLQAAPQPAPHRRRRKHRHHSHSPSHDRDSSNRDDKARKPGHKNRDTLLGAGGGALIGDVIFPGLGTAAGLLFGAYGGRKHAEKKRKRRSSDYSSGRKKSSDG